MMFTGANPILNEEYLDAAHEGDVQKLKQLFGEMEPKGQQAGRQVPDLGAVNKDQYSALHLAANKGHLEAIRWLLAKGLDPGLKTESGNTALMLAIEYGREQVADLLVAKMVEGGADKQELMKE